jgi:hypothetical protein
LRRRREPRSRANSRPSSAPILRTIPDRRIGAPQ